MDEIAQMLRELTDGSWNFRLRDSGASHRRKYFQSFGEISQDHMGSVIVRKEGASAAPRVMVAAHMDEIGFMVKHITPEGFLKFIPLGGWFDQVLLGQRVIVKTRKGDVVGVIGVKPPHLMPKDDRGKIVQRKDMYIDIGASSAEEVSETGVRVGMRWCRGPILRCWPMGKAICRRLLMTAPAWR